MINADSGLHPVYAFEICMYTTLAACCGDHDEDRTPLGAVKL